MDGQPNPSPESIVPQEVPLAPQVSEKKSSLLLFIFLGILLLGLGGVGGYLVAKYPSSLVSPVACTMEAKICPDGSAVGRSGPKCEFAACPQITQIPLVTQSAVVASSSSAIGWKTYQNSDFSFQYPQLWILDSGGKKIIANDSVATLWAFGSGDPMYNECMKVDKTEVQESLLVKTYSTVSSTEACSGGNSVMMEKWITRVNGDGYAPGIQYIYTISQQAAAETVFNQILSTFEFLE